MVLGWTDEREAICTWCARISTIVIPHPWTCRLLDFPFEVDHIFFKQSCSSGVLASKRILQGLQETVDRV